MTRKIQQVYLLTPVQSGILFHTISTPESGQYVVQIALSLNGRVDPQREQQAWNDLVARHDALRTAFVWEGQKQPLQAVGFSAKPQVSIEDLAHLAPQHQTDAINSFLASDRRTGFDLRRAPLLRIKRFDLGQGQHRLVTSFHHIVLDGWSIPLLLRDWIALYAGTPLPPARNFKDYLGWLQQQDKAQAKAFWAQTLAKVEDAPAPPLPAPDIASPDTPQTPRGDVALCLDETLTTQLREIAQARRLTASTLVHGMWAVLLGRYHDRDSVCYGLARAGRPATLKAASERVGMFLNTLPMAIGIDASAPALDWLAGVQAAHLAQQPHEHLGPVEVQATSAVPQGTPLMQSAVVFENYPTDPALLGQVDDFEIDEIDIREQTNFPLTLFAQQGKRLELKLLFDAQTICPEAALRMLGHLRQLFMSFAADPSAKLADLTQLSQAEIQAMEQHSQPLETAPRLPSISQAIAAHPSEAIAVTSGQSLTYGALNRQANQLAQALADRGIARGARIGVCLSRGAQIPVALLAILRCGAAYVPLDPDYPVARLSHIVSDSDLGLILSDTETAKTAASLVKDVLDLASLPETAPVTAPDAGHSPYPDFQPAAGDIAYVIYTSGSTGRPKGVPIHHGALINLLGSFLNRLALSAQNSWLAVTTLSFDIATLEILLPLVAGARLVLPHPEVMRDPARLAAALTSERITHLQATPSMWRMLVESGWSGAPLVALTGGEAIDARLAQTLMDRTATLWNVYGPTETTIWSTALQLRPEHLAQGTVPIGGALDNTQLRVLNRAGQSMPQGIPGELCILGAGLSAGYNKRQDLTDQQFVSTQDGSRYYRTGDLVRWRQDGTLDYLGRMDTQTKLRGHRIELSEIEAALTQHQQVDQAIALIEGTGATARLVACVRLNADLPDQALRSHLAEALPHYMLPGSYQRFDSFPQTLNGKVDRKALVRQIAVVQSHAITPEQMDAPMAQLAQIWCALLQIDSVSPQDSFFDLGGHSLLLVTLQDQLRRDMHVTLEITDFFRFPGLQSLSDHIAEQQATAADDAVQPPQNADPTTPTDDSIETRNRARATGKDRLNKRRGTRNKQRPEHA